jgi:cytochrome c oxidase assembly protein subunit 15
MERHADLWHTRQQMAATTTRRAVGWWLLVMAALVVVQVVLGGITRLTDSGLSITEWKPLLGVIPPTTDAEWSEAFAKYQQIPQFQQLKSHLTPQEFRFIYFWEWFHRLWGRMLGVAFAVPLVVFWRRGLLEGLRTRLLVLFGLGGLQGLMGWVMVASGLQDLVYVSHLRLAAHFMLAMLLLTALVWVGVEQLGLPGAPVASRRLQTATRVLFGALALQLTMGALMAGLKAALFAPTWPTINGAWIPSFNGGWWWNDPLAIHLVHRTLAYLVALAVVAWWWASRAVLSGARHVALGLVVLQVLLGITVTVRAIYPGELVRYGVLHQLVGVLLLVSLTVAVVRVKPPAPHSV